MTKRLAIIGAGPIGLEAALRGKKRGFEVSVFERGMVGANLRRWGHVRFFTPIKDNVSPIAWEALASKPKPDFILTGQEFAEQILDPLAKGPLSGIVHEQTEVLHVSKRRLLKHEMPGHPIRAERPFQLLVQNSEGERMVETDILMDAGGVYGNPNGAGESGLPPLGEKIIDGKIGRFLTDIEGQDKTEYIGKTIVLIGSGHSAATALHGLSELHRKDPHTIVHWVVRTDRARPCPEVPNDPLQERARMVTRANEIAEKPLPGWTVHRKSALLECGQKNGRICLVVGRGTVRTVIEADKILSLTGYRPALSHLEGLQFSISPITGGAGALATALLGITDCLSPVNVKPEQLRSGEGNFFLIGHRSYGRLNTFLLRSGLQQLDQIFQLL